MITIDSSQRDWIFLRQALALSMASGRQVTLGGALDNTTVRGPYGAVLEDCIAAASIMEAGEIRKAGSSLVCLPGQCRPGTRHFDTGRFSAAAEVVLFILPALFTLDFRSVITLSGVTHSPLSHGTAFFKETFFPLLERMGLYASLSLRRFGFYGSGGGACEVRVYPREEHAWAGPADGPRRVYRAQVFSSGISGEAVKRLRELITAGAGIPDEGIATIDVIDADGPGIALQIFGECGDLPTVHYACAAFYNEAGDYIFDEDEFHREIGEMMKRLRASLLPSELMREAAIFGMLAAPTVTLRYAGWEDLTAPFLPLVV